MLLKGIALSLYVALVLLLFKSFRPYRIAPYFYLLNIQFFSLISLIMIESGSWIMEENRSGFPNGAFWLYFIFCLVTMGGYLLGAFNVKIPSITTSIRVTNRKEFIIMSMGMVFFMILFGYASFRAIGVPGLHNHDFLTYTYPVWTITFMATTMNALAWYGIFRLDRIPEKFFFGFLYALNVKLAGTQFGGFIIVGLVLFISATFVKKIKLSYLFLGVFIVFTFASLVKIYSTIVLHHPWTFVIDRLAEQAHVFWYSVNLWLVGKNVNLGLFEWLRNYFHIHYVLNDQYSVGKVMTNIDDSMAHYFFTNGIAFETDLPGVMLIGPGLLPALVLTFIGAFLFAKLFFFLIKIAREFSFILFLLYFRIFDLFNEFYLHGDFGFFNIKITGYIFLFLILYFFAGKYFKSSFEPVAKIISKDKSLKVL